MNTRTNKQRRHTTADEAATHFTYESSYKLHAFLAASSLGARGEDRAEGFRDTEATELTNPHPTLSLGKGRGESKRSMQ